MTYSTLTVLATGGLAFVVLLVGCATPGGPLTQVGKPPPVENITVTVSGCETDRIELAVRPWEAYVVGGRPLRWTVPQGVDSMRVVPKGDWPFPGQPPVGLPGVPIQAGNVNANAPIGNRYSYSIIITCGGRVIDIDPDIIIREPPT
jgi:hypothetical protein